MLTWWICNRQARIGRSEQNGVKQVSATEVISAGPEGIILKSVQEGYAEYYSADLSEKVVRGMTENALKGIYNGSTFPFGYMIDETRHYQPDPLLAPYVEQSPVHLKKPTMVCGAGWIALNGQNLKAVFLAAASMMPGRLCSTQRPCSRHTTLGGMCKE